METIARHAQICDGCNREIKESNAQLGQSPIPLSHDSPISADMVDWRDANNPQKRQHHFHSEACMMACLAKRAKDMEEAKASLDQIQLKGTPSTAHWEVNIFAANGMTPKEKTQHHHDSKPYGDVEYADPKNNKYPVNTPEHVRAAWSYIHHSKNSGEYSPSELSAIKSKIRQAAKRHGVELSEQK